MTERFVITNTAGGLGDWLSLTPTLRVARDKQWLADLWRAQGAASHINHYQVLPRTRYHCHATSAWGRIADDLSFQW